MKIEFIGKFYDNHSLTIINRNIVTKLSKKFDVFITPLDKFDPQYKISSDAVKELKKLHPKLFEMYMFAANSTIGGSPLIHFGTGTTMGKFYLE